MKTSYPQTFQVPMIENFEGSDPRNYKVARNETYIDEDGVQKETVSYSLEDGLTVWYDLAEIR